MNQFDICIRAMKNMGCGVTVKANSVKVRFPADPNDPSAAPDGEEREYDKTYFTLLITRTFMELVEEEIIDANGCGP